MRSTLVLLAVLSAAMTGGAHAPVPSANGSMMPAAEGDTISLPRPDTRGRMTLEETIVARRSVREFLPDPLTLGELSQLLWVAQGVTSRSGLRAAPSAGALYPLEVYVVMPTGRYKYEPSRHRLTRRSRDDLRVALGRAALSQASVSEAPVILVIAAEYARTEVKYGRDRGPRYVHMEVGHAAQNVLLEAVALGLAAVPIGAFDDAQVRAVLGLPERQEPLYLIPVGRPGP